MGTRDKERVIAEGNPLFEQMLAGERFEGQIELFGVRHFSAYQPILNQNKDGVAGILFVATPHERCRSSRNLAIANHHYSRIGHAGSCIYCCGLCGAPFDAPCTQDFRGDD